MRASSIFSNTVKLALTLVALAVCVNGAAHAAQSCEPSRWGADDEIGNANLITPLTVLAASRLIKTGKTYSLGVTCLLYTSPSPRDQRGSRMPSSA